MVAVIGVVVGLVLGFSALGWTSAPFAGLASWLFGLIGPLARGLNQAIPHHGVVPIWLLVPVSLLVIMAPGILLLMGSLLGKTSRSALHGVIASGVLGALGALILLPWPFAGLIGVSILFLTGVVCAAAIEVVRVFIVGPLAMLGAGLWAVETTAVVHSGNLGWGAAAALASSMHATSLIPLWRWVLVVAGFLPIAGATSLLFGGKKS